MYAEPPEHRARNATARSISLDASESRVLLAPSIFAFGRLNSGYISRSLATPVSENSCQQVAEDDERAARELPPRRALV